MSFELWVVFSQNAENGVSSSEIRCLWTVKPMNHPHIAAIRLVFMCYLQLIICGRNPRSGYFASIIGFLKRESFSPTATSFLDYDNLGTGLIPPPPPLLTRKVITFSIGESIEFVFFLFTFLKQKFKYPLQLLAHFQSFTFLHFSIFFSTIITLLHIISTFLLTFAYFSFVITSEL